MSNHKGVLILTASAGGGHIVAARALEHEFRRQAPDLTVEVLDALALTRPYFRRAYGGGYLALVRHAPALFGWLYDRMDSPDPGWLDRARRWLQNQNRARLVREVRARSPCLVVCTHYLPAEFIAQMKQAGMVSCCHVIVTTDYETHRMWVQEPCDCYYTATPDARYLLTTWGVAPDRILVTGIPVRPGFDDTLDPADARRRCGLPEASATVLMLCGGFGVGPAADLLRALATLPAPTQVVVIVGRNEKLQRQLERQAGTSDGRVRVVGYTDRVHEWMRAADIVVSKPGGLTVAEALACGRPLVIVNPIPGQETRNADYLLENGAAIKVNHLRLLAPRVSALLDDRRHLERMQAAARALARPLAAADIARDALKRIAG